MIIKLSVSLPTAPSRFEHNIIEKHFSIRLQVRMLGIAINIIKLRSKNKNKCYRLPVGIVRKRHTNVRYVLWTVANALAEYFLAQRRVSLHAARKFIVEPLHTRPNITELKFWKCHIFFSSSGLESDKTTVILLVQMKTVNYYAYSPIKINGPLFEKEG